MKKQIIKYVSLMFFLLCSNLMASDLKIASPFRTAGTEVRLAVPTNTTVLGLGTPLTPYKLFISETDGNTNPFAVSVSRTGVGNSGITFLRSDGTQAVPTAISLNYVLGQFNFQGYDGATYASGATLSSRATEAWTGTTHGAQVRINTVLNGSTTIIERVTIDQNGNVGFTQTSPTATVHIRAGTAAASSAPLKFTAGTALTTAEAGAVEYDGTNLFYTDEVPTRNRIATVLTGTSASIGGGALLAGACANTTTAVTGAATTMAVIVTPTTYPGNGNFWHGYVSSAGNVTVSVCAAVAATPTASTYIIRVVK